MGLLVVLLAVGAAWYCGPGHISTQASPLNAPLDTPLNSYDGKHAHNTRHKRAAQQESRLVGEDVLNESDDTTRLTDNVAAIPKDITLGVTVVTAPEVVPPVIYSQTLGPVYIKNNNDYANIYCNATDGVTISWEYQGENITNETVRHEIKQATGIQFNINPLGNHLTIFDQSQNKSLNGYIQCFVANAAGATFGDRVFVTHAVLQFYSIYSERRTMIDAIEGDHVTLSCDRDIQNDPLAHVQWFFERSSAMMEHPIDPRTHTSFFCNDLRTVCVVSNLTHDDAGVYRCTYNIAETSKDLYKMFILTVKAADDYPSPRNPLNLMDHVSSPSVVESQLGRDVGLRCVFRGHKGDRVTWTYARADVTACDIQEISLVNSTDRLVLEKNGTFLLIKSLTVERQGYYMCVADNGYDRYTHRIHVKLVAPPVLTERIHGEEAYLGEDVRFNCSAPTAIPPAAATWWVNMRQVPTSGLGRFHLEDNGDVLVLEGATVSDTASITCNVSNKEGSVVGHRYVTVRNVTMATTTEMPTTEFVREPTTDKTTFIPTTTTTATTTTTTTAPTTTTTTTKITSSTAPDTTVDGATIDSHPAEGATSTMEPPVTRDSTVTSTPAVQVTSQTGQNVIGLKSRATANLAIGSANLTVILCVSSLVVGIILGILIGWCVTRKRVRKHKLEASADVIENENLNNIEFTRSPLHKLEIDGTTNRSETLSMMHQGSVQDTIT